MTQTSYPLVGAALTGAQWRVIQDVGDGITNDLTGLSYAFAVTGADTGTIGLGQYRVDGVVHEISAAESVTLAAVSSPTTYLIGLKVDFALENTAGQIALVSGVKTTLLAGLTGAQVIVPLYEVDRAASTILSASVVRDLRVWSGEQIMSASLSAAPADAPIGSVLRTTSGSSWYRRRGSSGPEWAGVLADPVELTAPTLASGWAPYSGTPVQVRKDALGGLRFSGLAQRTGSAITLTGGNTSLIGTLPADLRPTLTRFPQAHTGAGVFGLSITPSGQILLRSPSPQSGTAYTLPTTGWVSFDSIVLEV